MEKEKEIDTTKYFGNNLMNLIIAETFARHSKLTEKEYLERLGLDKSGKPEEEVLRIAKFNVMLEITKNLFHLKNRFNMATEIIKTMVIEEKLTEDEPKGE